MGKIGLAIIGAGGFINTQHIPALIETGKFEVVAVFSRSAESAKATAKAVNLPDSSIYYEKESTEKNNLTALLNRKDVQAVTIATTILSQPDYIIQAFEAGKHVLSEKPIAKDIETAKKLIQKYDFIKNEKYHNLIWVVAEQFRYNPLYIATRKLVRDKLGKILFFNLQSFSVVDKGHTSFDTPWRQTPQYQGGFLLDGGVHWVALLRRVIEHQGEGDDNDVSYSSPAHIKYLSSAVAQVQKHLPPSDTLASTITLSNGVIGNLLISWGAPIRKFSFDIYGQNGVISVDFSDSISFHPREPVDRSKALPEPIKFEIPKQYPFQDAILNEYVAFAEAIESGKVPRESSPIEALADVAFIELSLKSGKNHAESTLFTY